MIPRILGKVFEEENNLKEIVSDYKVIIFVAILFAKRPRVSVVATNELVVWIE